MTGGAAQMARSAATARSLFQRVSYLQYPAMLVAVAYAVKSGLSAASAKATGWAPVFDDLNYVLLYAGIGIGLSSLQDSTKTQNGVSLRIWRNPRKGRWMLMLLSAYAFSAMALGLLGAYMADSTAASQLSMGLVAFGLGMVGLLKTAIEMREHHRSDNRIASPERSLT